MKKNVLICLEKLDIGGVETFVLNQASVLISKGHNVVILAKHGCYTEKLEQKGVICIDFEFDLRNTFCPEKIKKIEEIIKEYNINEVHINQFPCILSAMPACLFSGIPYIAYSHNTTDDAYQWFESTFNIYGHILGFYFENAYKIIAITQHAKDEVIKRFEINEKNIEVINNSINFEETDMLINKKVNAKKHLLLISRLANEKKEAIYNGINFFNSYKRKLPDATLSILGSGPLQSELEEYVKNNNLQGIEFKGASTKVLETINEEDIILGLDRCILEAISMKKLAIIIGYKEIKGLVIPNNIELASQDNFSGNNLLSQETENIIESLLNYTDEEIEDIINQNYDFAKKYLNAFSNYNVINVEEITKTPIGTINLLKYLISKQEEINSEEHKIKEMQEQINKIENELLNIEKDEKKENKIKSERIIALEKELKDIYSSKRWRYTEKLSKIFHKKF